MLVSKPILCLDFDGVVNSYKNGFTSVGQALDGPTFGAKEFIEDAQRYFTVAIFSSRSAQTAGLECMMNYAQHYFGHEIADKIQFPINKPFALVTLDDRAITFNGQWPDPMTLMRFKPWHTR